MEEMRIAIISSANIMHMTLISHYTNLIDLKDHTLDLIYMDKYGESEDFEANNIFRYETKVNADDNKLVKIKKYYGFKKFVKTVINNNDYDLYIIWNSYTAQLLGPKFFKNIKGNYILNIRDYTYEKNYLIFKRLEYIIKNSIFTTVSSEGFYDFLPKSTKYLMLHSINSKIIKQKNDTISISNTRPIKISFIGNVRFYEQNILLINAFKNNKKFLLQYYGVGSEPLKEYCTKNSIENVKFLGRFKPEETIKLLQDTDILNNYYGNQSIALTKAISIRMYYSIFMLKPIIVAPNTITSQITEDIGIGFSREINSNYPEQLENWYLNIDNEEILKNRDFYLEKIHKDNSLFRNKFKRILMDEN
ncbi:capsular biosynthesis protein [Macrococcus equi]|uniref:capsular biosynthesis protein n=1 Tax=Macrococcus equi TaxID=3395462 RepID=UPI0039BDE211